MKSGGFGPGFFGVCLEYCSSGTSCDTLRDDSGVYVGSIALWIRANGSSGVS